MMKHVERLACGGMLLCPKRRAKLRRFAAAIAMLGALTHASEHVLLYMEGATAVRELLAITRIVKEA